MRSEWTERLKDWGIGYAVGILVMVLLVLLVDGCVLVRPWAPSGHPPCPKGHAWNDSTLACKAVPRER